MSQHENVTATLTNNTQYTFVYASVDTAWGNYYNQATTIGPNMSVVVFFAIGAEGSATGCQGNVVYNFVDQNGNTDSIGLSYEDPYSGSNSFSITVPSGMTGSATQPSGGPVAVTYTVGGQIT